MVTLTPRQRLYQIIFGTQTRYGQLFDIGLIIAIISSEIILIISSVTSIESKFSTTLYILEWFFTLLFTVEYILRLYCSPKP